MGIFYKMSHIGDEIHGLKPFCTPYETDYGKLKRKDIAFSLSNYDKSFQMTFGAELWKANESSRLAD